LLELHVDQITLPDGSRVTREIVSHPGAAAVVPILPDGVLLVRQYRHAVRSYLWEIPAGKLELGEKPLCCAQRELAEETGYVAKDWAELASFYTSPGFSDEQITLFHASDLQKETSRRTDEIADCRVFPLPHIEQMILRSKITDAKTILAIAWIGRRLSEGGQPVRAS